MSEAHLVVGADSLVGKRLLAELEGRGIPTYGTTRRPGSAGEKRLHLDFADPSAFQIPGDASVAYIVAAATNYERCATDPMARTINVELTPRTVIRLLDAGLHVVFVSTNAVFGGETPWPEEDAAHDPRIPYAVQKHDAEQALSQAAEARGARNRLAIVRLTKVLAPDTPPLPAWLESWRQRHPVQPFSDLVFAPVSVGHVAASLSLIGASRISGNLHVSGAQNVSYVDLARTLADRFGIDPALVAPTTASEKGISIAFKPRYSGLAMTRTTRLAGLRPQLLASVVADLFPPAPS
jgi:dTDP-4-dehydrorhamnose reductase